MAEQSKIEWTDATWNPITGCTLVDEGCRNCYAADLASTRLKNHPSRKGLARKNGQGVAKFTGEVRFNEYWLDQPLKWKTPRMIFVCAHGDLFHESVPDAWIDQVFAVMSLCPQHTFQVLTKRPERARAYLLGLDCDGARRFHVERFRDDLSNRVNWQGDKSGGIEPEDERLALLEQDIDWPLPNVWLGTSVSEQQSANERVPHLLQAPAATRFISAEPLLGSLNLTCISTMRWRSAERLNALTGELSGMFGEGAGTTQSIDWVIVGGESGRKARPMHSNWARSLRDQCVSAGTAFHFKQWGMWLPEDQACPSSLDGSPVDSIDQWDWSDADERGALHHWDDQSASIHLRKNEAGRFLDGREWNEVPS